MKGFRQSRLLKAVAVVLLFFSIIGMPLSVVGEAYLAYEIFDRNWEEMFGGNFEDTDNFSELFSTRIGQLAEYTELKNVLETDGVLDYNKDVDSAVQGGYDFPGSGKNTIGELIKNNSFFVEDIDSANVILLEVLFDKYPREQYYVYTDENGNAALGAAYVEKFIKDFHSDADWLLVDRYEEAVDIWNLRNGAEMAEEQKLETAAASDAWMAVYDSGKANAVTGLVSAPVQEQTAGTDALPDDAAWVYTFDDLAYYYTYYVAYYNHYQTLFGEDYSVEHRMVYRLGTEDGIYTNEENIEQYLNGTVPTIGELYYGSAAYTVDTNVANVSRGYVDNLEKAVLATHDSFDLYVGVTRLADTPHTQDDAFTIRENYFNKAQSLAGILLIVGIASVFCAVLSGFYLAASAGHEKDVEGVRLTWFDKWYTEVAAAVCVIVVPCCVMIEVGLINEFYWYGVDILVGFGIVIGAVVCYFAALFSLASLARRIKAKTLWKNSLVRNGGSWLVKKGKRFAQGCRVVYQEREITTRVIIAYLMVLAATVITGALVMITLFEGSMLILFFLLLFAGIHGGTLYMLLRERMEYKRITESVERIAGGELNYKVDTAGMQSDNKRLAVAVNDVGNGLAEAIEKSIKDERMKTDLITNVSHDIKTPLTSIINYVDLLKREKIEDEKIQSYIEVLDNKSQRLKNLTDDLVEASKLSSGTVVLTMQEINLVELVNQANGEFTEKFAQKNLTIVPTLPDSPVIIEADGRRIWRVLENLYNNVSKYAMENTRVYVAVVPEEGRVAFVMKNISANPLNINADELTERFIRGDVSRSTEGSGLGLSIARSLTELMNGSFDIYLDGDLFRVTVAFPVKG